MSIYLEKEKEKKRGKLSREEESIISSNIGSKSDEEIAAIINRDPSTVAKYRMQIPVLQNNDSISDIIIQLHKKFFWTETRRQLVDSDEIAYFENYWGYLVQQFAGQGITATDEQMMRDLILIDIQVNRSNKNSMSVRKEIQDIEDQIEQINSEYVDDPVGRVSKLPPLLERLNVLRSNIRALTEEYKILADKKDKKYEQLKSTRQLRLEKVEKSGRSFFDLVKMLDSSEIREKEGRLNEFYKYAAELARLRFEEYYKYDNDQIDRPFLTPEAEEKNNV
jgi:hypothetical protein